MAEERTRNKIGYGKRGCECKPICAKNGFEEKLTYTQRDYGKRAEKMKQ